jgi:hypothetical protein
MEAIDAAITASAIRAFVTFFMVSQENGVRDMGENYSTLCEIITRS